MTPLDYIKKHWNFGKSIEQNAIYFNTKENQAKKTRNKMILLSLFVVGLSLLFHNPALSFLLLIGALSFGSEYVFTSNTIYNVSITKIDSTHFIAAYRMSAALDEGRAIIGTISNGTEIAYGTEYNFSGSNVSCSHIHVGLLDSTHFVITYQAANTAYGSAIIGVISNTDDIAFGAIHTYTVGAGTQNCVGIIDSTHFVVAYEDAGSYADCIARVGIVASGNDITFGTAYTFSTNAGSYMSLAMLDSTHFVVSYQDGGASSYGVSTIGVISSTTTINYGSDYTFYAGICRETSMTALDSTHFVIAHCLSDNKGYAIVGVVSNGDDITFGTDYVFNNANTYNPAITSLDSTNFVISYKDAGNTNKGTSIVGTVSNGDDIAFGDETLFNDAVTAYTSIGMLDSTHFVVGYSDGGNSNYGTAIVGVVSYVTSPTVTTQAATDLASTSCTGNGNITNTGGENCTRQGFCYKTGTSGDPTTADSVAYNNGDYGTGAYTKSITSLTAGTAYRVRAYAVNSGGTGYGDTVQVYTNYTMTASNTAFTLTGIDIGITKGFQLIAQTTAYVLTGLSANIVKGFQLIAQTTAYTLTGVDALIVKGWGLVCQTTNYVLTTFNVIFKGVGSWQIVNQTKHDSTAVNQTKHSASCTNETKHSGSIINQDK